MGPFTIWLLEMVQNYALVLTFERNTASCYVAQPYRYFHGAIDLGMYYLWWNLAVVLEVCYPRVLIPATKALSRYVDLLLLILVGTVTLIGVSGIFVLPRYPPARSVWPHGQLLGRGLLYWIGHSARLSLPCWDPSK